VDFEKRSSIKPHILADFITEWTKPQSQIESTAHESPWLLYYNGAWGNAGAVATTILNSHFGIKLCYVARLQFTNETQKCTNNIAEYKAILLGLHKLAAIGV
jgi:hypothetical protein